MSNSTYLKWIPVQQTYFWTSNVTAFKVGNATANQYALSTAYNIIFDSGTALGYFPHTIGDKIIKKILKGIKHIKFNGRYYCSCDTTLYSSFYLLINGLWLEISPMTYVMTHSSSKKTSGHYSCVLGFAT